MNKPVQKCADCGAEWIDSHVCDPIKKGVRKFSRDLAKQIAKKVKSEQGAYVLDEPLDLPGSVPDHIFLELQNRVLRCKHCGYWEFLADGTFAQVFAQIKKMSDQHTVCMSNEDLWKKLAEAETTHERVSALLRTCHGILEHRHQDGTSDHTELMRDIRREVPGITAQVHLKGEPYKCEECKHAEES